MTLVLFMLSCAFEFLWGYMVGTNLERKRIGKQMKRGYIVMEGSLFFCNNPPIKIITEVHDATQEEIEAYEQSRKEGTQ